MTHYEALLYSNKDETTCLGELIYLSSPFHTGRQWNKYFCGLCGVIVYDAKLKPTRNYERDPDERDFKNSIL